MTRVCVRMHVVQRARNERTLDVGPRASYSITAFDGHSITLQSLYINASAPYIQKKKTCVTRENTDIHLQVKIAQAPYCACSIEQSNQLQRVKLRAGPCAWTDAHWLLCCEKREHEVMAFGNVYHQQLFRGQHLRYTSTKVLC